MIEDQNEPEKVMPAGVGAGRGIEARITDHAIRLCFLGLFLYWSLTLVFPFFQLALWSIILSVALYPIYARLQKWLGGRGSLAAAILTGTIVLVVAGPIALLISSLSGTIIGFAGDLDAGTIQLPPPPAHLADLPLVGDRVFKAWSLASSNVSTAVEKLQPYLQAPAGAFLHTVANLGKDLLLLLVAVVIAGCLFRPGPRLASEGRRFANRLLVPRGAHFVDLAGATIRNVSRGVFGLAFLQMLLSGTVLLAVGVPGAGFAALLVLVLCILQIGPLLVLIPIAVWAWWSLPLGAALATTVLLVTVGAIDNVLKPILMARGLDTPTFVILIGVIGGTLTYGLVGLFLGPVVLAVFFELLAAWVNTDQT